MWDFSDDEWVCLIAAAVAAVVGLQQFYLPLFYARSPRGAAWGGRLILGATPVLALAFLWWVIQGWGDPVNVVGHGDYQFLFLVCGAAWIASVFYSLSFVGYSVRDDAIERNNPAAVAVTVGAVFGFTLIFAGGNIGYGETIWTTLIPAFIASGILFLLWMLSELVTGTADAVTIDRDLASGLRLAGFLVCSGAILGRAIAGDWNGWDGMSRDIVDLGWPVLILFVLYPVCHAFLKPTPKRARPSGWAFGVVPFIWFVAIAGLFLLRSGAPVVAPRSAATQPVIRR